MTEQADNARWRSAMGSTARTFPTERILVVVVLLLAGIGLFAGWRLFWFLTDDAYIAFRYVSNSQLGYGYVWNPPPFLPVEGYTSFLWVGLLDIVWRILRVEPPVSANWISLAFSYGTLVLSASVLAHIPWRNGLGRWRVVFLIQLVLFLLLNRTFLAWSSSGLETAMLDFFVIAWVFAALCCGPSPRQACLVGITAAALTLSRPDGLLYVAASLAIIVSLALRAPDRRRARLTMLCGLLPLGIVLVHQAWRVSFYGAWLPNTYYAKVSGFWPISGCLYLLSFALEYGVWFAGAAICWALLKNLIENKQRLANSSTRSIKDLVRTWEIPVVVVSTLLLHLGYYTFVVGGDHFEYRVYAHSLPLIFLALVWSLSSRGLSPRSAATVVLAFVLLSMPVQWTHWALTRSLATREQTYILQMRIAPHWPLPVRWYADIFDEAQSWLIRHYVCMRHQEHKVFWQTMLAFSPSREEGMRVPQTAYPVMAAPCVGILSWVLPHVSIIDTLGLNDYVIARTPEPENQPLFMAHSRRPPKDYVESFRPNVSVLGPRVFVQKRTEPVTADTIVATERYWRDRTKASNDLLSATVVTKSPGGE